MNLENNSRASNVARKTKNIGDAKLLNKESKISKSWNGKVIIMKVDVSS